MTLPVAANFAEATVDPVGYDAAATSITVATGEGANLPAAPNTATWFNATDYSRPPLDPNRETIYYATKVGDVLGGVIRGQETAYGSPAASAKNLAGKTYMLLATPTAGFINDYLGPLFTAKAAHYVYAGPASGANATPTFRAIVSADLPDLSSIYLTPTAAAAAYQPVGSYVTGSLTSGRIPFATGAQALSDSADLTWDGDTLATTTLRVGPPESDIPAGIRGYYGAPNLITAGAGSEEAALVIEAQRLMGIGVALFAEADPAFSGPIGVSAEVFSGHNYDRLYGFSTYGDGNGYDIDLGAGLFVYSYNPRGGTTKTYAAVWSDDQAGAATHPYYAWFDSRGVFRIKEDDGFDGVGQAIAALYNPQFEKYSTGSLDFERGILGRWNGHVFEVGPEIGDESNGSILRPMRLLGESVAVVGDLTAANISGENTGDQDLSGYVLASRTVNGHALSANVTITKTDVGLGSVENAAASALYQPIGAYATAANAMAFSNKTGNISQWTNDSGFTTLAAVSGVGYLTAVTAHNLLSATHGDTTAGTVARGDVITGQSVSATWKRLAKGTANQVLAMDGTATDVVWATISAGGAGTVTSIATTSPISGGTITGTGTLSLLTNVDFGFTAGQTITSPAGSTALTLTGGTQTTSFPIENLTQTWNASGVTFTGWRANITNTASAVGSMLFDWQSGGNSQFSLLQSTGRLKWNTAGGGTSTICSLLPLAFGMEIDVNNGTNICKFDTGPSLTFSANASYVKWNEGVRLYGPGAATLQIGVDVNGAAVSQTIQAANGITGTDKTGGNFTVASGKGTGAGAVSQVLIQTPTVLGSGTTAQSLATRVTIDSSGLKATGYLSSDGTAGATGGPWTSVTVKNGLVVSGS